MMHDAWRAPARLRPFGRKTVSKLSTLENGNGMYIMIVRLSRLDS
jgi:hypothetical protein